MSANELCIYLWYLNHLNIFEPLIIKRNGIKLKQKYTEQRLNDKTCSPNLYQVDGKILYEKQLLPGVWKHSILNAHL